MSESTRNGEEEEDVDSGAPGVDETPSGADEDEALEAVLEDPLATARAESLKFKEQWMRTAADFDNFRKRSRREIEDARRGAKEDLLKELLPVFDNLERAMQSAQRATDVKALADGIHLVAKQFESTLGRVGIRKVPSVGLPFDPAVHEAIQQVETDEHPAGTVVAEVQPGYVVTGERDKLVRAAMVVVAKSKSAEIPES
jgi:molecular chaperone GrpE